MNLSGELLGSLVRELVRETPIEGCTQLDTLGSNTVVGDVQEWNWKGSGRKS